MTDPQHFSEAEQQDGDTYRCPKCLHVFPWKSLGVPCPHCIIEELRTDLKESREKNGTLALKNVRLVERIKLALAVEGDWRLQGSPEARLDKMREILGDEE